MNYARSIFRSVFLLVVAGVIISCALGVYPDIERGSEYQFQEGYPEVRISALGFLDENEEGIVRIAAEIVEESLTYSERDGAYYADLQIEVRIVGTEGMVYEETYATAFSIERAAENASTARGLTHYQNDFGTPPGTYQVYFSVVDRATRVQTTRSSQTSIPDPAAVAVNVSSIQLSAGAPQNYRPVTTYDVSMANDSIRFIAQVINSQSNDPLTIDSRLIRFEADTSAARSMVFNNYAPSTLPYNGIDYNSSDILEESQRVLDGPGIVHVEYRYPVPERGNYRFQLQAEGREEELFKARDFGVKSSNYPALRNSRELAQPLIYLMGEGDHEELSDMDDSDSLKAAIDNFWLSNIGDEDLAREVVALYYGRVEEANKQFSNFKEGWKTDMGMIYVLFGPPSFTKRHFGGWIWSYSYNISNPEYHFRFIRPRTRREPSFPFDHYILEREQGNFNIQSRQIQLWLSGNILERRLAPG